jgi:hypothetical protein
MKRIFLITQIVQRGVTDLPGRDIFGTAARDATVCVSELCAETNKKGKDHGPPLGTVASHGAILSNQGNPIHPDETLNSVAGPKVAPNKTPSARG